VCHQQRALGTGNGDQPPWLFVTSNVLVVSTLSHGYEFLKCMSLYNYFLFLKNVLPPTKRDKTKYFSECTQKQALVWLAAVFDSWRARSTQISTVCYPKFCWYTDKKPCFQMINMPGCHHLQTLAWDSFCIWRLETRIQQLIFSKYCPIRVRLCYTIEW
jgi:hypothetical protein